MEKKDAKIKVETERLVLRALSSTELRLALEDYDQFEDLLGLERSGKSLDDEIKYAFGVRLKKVEEAEETEDSYPWHTVWSVIKKETKTIVGSFMIKGSPNEKGEVIVGYGIDKEHQNNGFATEALIGLKAWIFNEPKVIAIFGDTDKENVPSHKVLMGAGGINVLEKNDTIWWKISRV